MKIQIYGSRRQQPYYQEIRSLIYGLLGEGAELSMHQKLYDHLTGDLGMTLVGVTRTYDCVADADLTISLGGDGTLLRTVAWSEGSDAPVLGINTGHLGFLTAITLADAHVDIKMIMEMDFRRETLSMLSVEAPDMQAIALNEVVVAKDDSASMITASVTIDNKPLGEYKADGVIVATPTGSTAYNLSVGGPIVEPAAPVWVISPIAAHSLTLRPLVISDTSVVDIRVEGRGARFRLAVDGRPCSLPMGASVRISKSPRKVVVLQPHNRDFSKIISEKLSFNG